MTEPSVPHVVGLPAGQLRPVEHPDLSPLLTHFCGRGRQPGTGVPPGILGMCARDRLTSILHCQQLLGFTTYSGGDAAVCFTESTLPGIEFLLAHRGYQPWAVVFDRQSVYDAGGGPVWYARRNQYTALGMIDPALRSWAVRLDPGSDWLEEQEWRIVLQHRTDGFIPFVPLATLRLAAIIVGDSSWNGALEREYPDETGSPTRGLFYPPLPLGLQRWWWNSEVGKLQQLSPLY